MKTKQELLERVIVLREEARKAGVSIVCAIEGETSDTLHFSGDSSRVLGLSKKLQLAIEAKVVAEFRP